MGRNINEIASLSLNRRAVYSVLLPSKYESSNLYYPVLYLLHGLFGHCENWVQLTNIQELAKQLELIMVMPDGADGWYCDSETVADDRFESFVIADLIPEIDTRFRTLPHKEARAIAGLSMGGYGAFKFVAKRPDLFTFGASFSGAFDAPARSDEFPGNEWETLKPSILRAFGEVGSATRSENDLYQIFLAMPAEKIRALPFLYFDCGITDMFLEANYKLERILRKRGINHGFSALEGGHDWDYWGSRLPKLLKLTRDLLCRPRLQR